MASANPGGATTFPARGSWRARRCESGWSGDRTGDDVQRHIGMAVEMTSTTRQPRSQSEPASTSATSPAAPAPGDPTVYAPYMFALMLRNNATWGFEIADHNAPGNPPARRYTTTGCVIASPVVVGQRRLLSRQRRADRRRLLLQLDAGLRDHNVRGTERALRPRSRRRAPPSCLRTTSTLRAPVREAEAASDKRSTRPEGAPTGAADESDGPALRILTILQGYAGLDPATQNVAQRVIATDFRIICLTTIATSSRP